MPNFNQKMLDEIPEMLQLLRVLAEDVQTKYNRELAEKAISEKKTISGFMPRISKYKEGFYVYWYLFEVWRGSIVLKAKSGKTYRRSKNIRVVKKKEKYPAKSFINAGAKKWELPVILDAESSFSEIRIEVKALTGKLKELRAEYK